MKSTITKKAEKLYKKHEFLILQQANYYSKTYGVSLPEVISKANEIFMEAVWKFNENKKTKFSTYLVLSLKQLHKFLSKQNQYDSFNLPAEFIESFEEETFNYFNSALVEYDFEAEAISQENKESLSQKAKEILRLIFYPESKERNNQPAYFSRTSLRNYLAEIGWKQKEIRESFYEIKIAFSL